MGILSTKQIEYVTKLIKRNAVLQKTWLETDNEDARRLLQSALSKPINEPMTRSEESMRRRLRKKARQCAIVLGLLQLAGITPCKDGNYKDLAEYIVAVLNQISCEFTVQLTSGRESFIPFWVTLKVNDSEKSGNGATAQQPIITLSRGTQITAQQEK